MQSFVTERKRESEDGRESERERKREREREREGEKEVRDGIRMSHSGAADGGQAPAAAGPESAPG